MLVRVRMSQFGVSSCDYLTINHVCFAGVNTIAPSDNNTGIGGECMPGYYCPEGSERPISCPPGQYRSVIIIHLPEYSLMLISQSNRQTTQFYNQELCS